MPSRPTVHKPSMQQTRQESQQQYDKARAPDHAAAYDSKWRRLSKRFRIDNPLCFDCLAMGIVHEGDLVHHKLTVIERPDLRLDLDNLVHLCGQCHAKRHSNIAT